MRRAAPVLLALASLAAAATGAGQVEARLFPRGGGPVQVRGTVEGCASCHAEIAEEWQQSAHARSWTDPVFRAEYDPAPQAFCRRCHVPRARSARVTGEATRGIDCAVCHEREGALIGRGASGAQAHVIHADARLGESSFCAPCHEFAFPAREPEGRRPTYLPGRPLQATLTEHQRSGREETCQGCHMPRREGHVDHRFGGLGDPRLTRDAVRVRLRADHEDDGSLRVRVRLRAGEIGHAFPTGDMFRQARFEVRRGADVAVEPLMRWFSQVPHEDAFYLAEVDDTRVPPNGERRFDLSLPPGEGPARYRLDVWRLDPATARRRGLTETQVRVPIAAGRVPE